MDVNVYKAKLTEVRRAFAIIYHRIGYFGPDDVTLEDKNTYKDYIEKTRKLLEEAQDAAFKLCTELDNTSVYDYERIQEINQLETNAMWEYWLNACDIKRELMS